MSNSKSEKEELKKLEDEAYSELCQIIAEAMLTQDIVLLDQRIVYWKKKYKKLLDSNSSTSQNFKKRIEYLLNEYYSEITQYILKQIRKTEQKRLENQSKAIRRLRYIIDETDDLSLLEKKIKEWESKYPISGFLDMYQRRIKVYTSEKYLKEHAFDQDMAFRDLYYITKLSRTYDELKKEVVKWEDTYSINDKFKLDDFIKHQSEVIRYTSDDYLKGIAHEDNSHNQEITLPKKIKLYSEQDSTIPKQVSAISALMRINKNNLDEIFKWVYKYNSIRFNDDNKATILTIISLHYSPTYLNSLRVPKISLFDSLSFEEYQNIDEIKNYSVISYFNSLLPSERAMPNNYFNKNIEIIYRKFASKHLYNSHMNILKEDNEPKATLREIQIPELEIDISDGQVFSLANNIESIEEKNMFEPTQKDTKISDLKGSTDYPENVISKSLTSQEPSNSIEQDSLEEHSVDEHKKEKSIALESKVQRPQDTTTIIQEPKVNITESSPKLHSKNSSVQEKNSDIITVELAEPVDTDIHTPNRQCSRSC